MNWDQIEGKWKQMKGAAKQRWGKLTDDELDVISGKKDELVGKIQERYGVTREQALQQVTDWHPEVLNDEEDVPRNSSTERKAS